MAKILKNNDQLMKALLGTLYRVAVKNRLGRPTIVKMNPNVMNDVAHELDHPNLCKLFIKSQFHSMPVEFCRKHFNRSYPPANVVFGGRCWYRYEQYVERGINDGS